MIKEHIVFFRRLEITVDLCLAAIAFYVSVPMVGLQPVLVLFLCVWTVLLSFSGMYGSFRIKRISDLLLTVWSSAFIGIGIFGFAAYLFDITELNRFFVISIFLLAGCLITIEKVALMMFFRSARRSGYNYRNLLIIGTGARARQFMELVKRHSEWGLKITGLIDEDVLLKGKVIDGHPVMGTLRDVADVIHASVVDDVVIVAPRSWNHKLQEVIHFCEIEGIRVQYAMDFFNLQFAKTKQTDLEGFLLLTFERAPIKVWHLFLKRVFDVVLSFILLILLIPLLTATAIAIKATSPGAVFFKQMRCGVNGRKFTLYKFRTMVINAEELLAQLRSGNEMSGPVFKMKNDPRITPIGRFLRKSSIDELPQLWNVLKGDMSIVGPRPPIPEEVKKYDSWQRRRLSMRPGITCLWQVQGRNNITDFNEWARLDLEYIDRWSIWKDLSILVRTVPVVLFGIGAK